MIIRNKKKMKKALAIPGILALSITPTSSFACDLRGANLSNAILTDGDLRSAVLNSADLTGITATGLRGCPSSLPSGWVCENNSLIQR